MALRLFAAAAALAASLAAHADTVTYQVDVTATGGTQTVALSYALTFDATVDTLDPTVVGAQLLRYSDTDNRYNVSFNAPLTAWQYFYVPNASLVIGGVQSSAGSSLGLTPGDPGYLLDISFSNGIPSFTFLQEALASDKTNLTTLTTGTVTITPPLQTVAAVTPEPASFALLGTGLLGVVGMVRRRMA